jgi:hypothetical protein
MSELELSLAVNVLLGIILAGALSWRRLADSVRLSTPEQAAEVFRQHFPELSGAATLAEDRRSALLELGRGAGIGLLQRQGRRWNARVLSAPELASVRVDTTGALCLGFADFGWPRARIALAPEARAAWHARLVRLAARRLASAPGLHHA